MCVFLFRLYASPEQLKVRNFLWLGELCAKEHGTFLLVHTTTPPPKKPADNRSGDEVDHNSRVLVCKIM